MKGILLVLCRRGRRNSTGGSSFSTTLTGTTGGFAIIGDHASIGYTINPDNGTDTVKWSNSNSPSDPATYGTAATPTDYTAGDNTTLYCHVTDGGNVVTKTATIAYAAGTAPAIADGQSWTVDDTAISIDASASGANLTWTYSLSNEPAGVSINASSGLITGTVTSASSGTITVTATDQYGRTVQDTFTWSSSLRTQATGGVDLDLSFGAGSAITATDLTANWTENGNTVTYAIQGTALPSALTVSSSGSMTGTPASVTADATYTLRGTDEYSRVTDDTFTLEVTAVDATDPVINTSSYTDATQTLDITYTEANPNRLYWSTVTNPSTPTGTQIIAGAGGGILDAGDYAVTASQAISVSNEAADEIHLVMTDDAGNVSAVEVITGITVDSTLPAFSSAVTDTAGNTITITTTETVSGSPLVGDFSFSGITAGTPTIDSVTVSGTSITLEISGNLVANGDTVTVSYTKGANVISDTYGNEMATFASQSVTNNVPAASSPYVSMSHDGTGQTTYTFNNVTLPAGAEIAIIAGQAGSTLRTLTSATIDGVSATVRSNGTSANSKRMHLCDTNGSTVTGGTNRTISLTFSASVGFRASFAIFDVSGLSYIGVGQGNGASATTIATDATTTAGDTLITGSLWTLSGGTTVSGTGLTLDATENNESAHYMSALSETSAAGGSPESLDVNFASAVTGNVLTGVYR